MRSSPIISLIIAFSALLLLQSCAPVVYKSSIRDAQNLIDKGQYDLAAKELRTVIDSVPGTRVAADALYKLATLSFSEQNPRADFTSALDNFISFLALYPNDPRADIVKERIYLLKMYLNKKEDLETMLKLVTQFQKKYEKRRALQMSDLENLGRDISKCYDDRTSLSKKVEELKQVIIELERKCLKAGR